MITKSLSGVPLILLLPAAMSSPTINFHIQSRQTQFRIPIELIKKNFKNIQKLIEKEKKQLSEDILTIKSSDQTPQLKLELIRKVIKRFEAFKKKLELSIAKDEDYRERLICRLNNLKVLEECIDKEEEHKEEESNDESPTSQDIQEDDPPLNLHNPKLINWYRDETNLLIIDYLIKSNTNKDQNIGLSLLNNLSLSNPNIKKLLDFDLYSNFNQVFISIVTDHQLTLIIAWFNENRTNLKKLNSNLEFEINYCKFLSLIDQGDVNEAIKFSQLNLSKYGNKKNYQDNDDENYEYNLNKLKEIGGLLVYMAIKHKPIADETNDNMNILNNIGDEGNKSGPLETDSSTSIYPPCLSKFQFSAPSTSLLSSTSSFSSNIISNSPRFHEYQRLLSDERWNSLSQCFIENFTKLFGISKNYPLFIYLSAGLSSLKTKSCYHNVENTIFREDSAHQESIESIYKKDLAVLTDKKYRGPNQYYKLLNKINNCPVCSPELYKLSMNLPYAQLITSIFNNPFKLPNGNIYPFDKLLNPSEKYLSEKNTLLRMGKIKDPLTREIFLIDNCVRVYPA